MNAIMNAEMNAKMNAKMNATLNTPVFPISNEWEFMEFIAKRKGECTEQILNWRHHYNKTFDCLENKLNEEVRQMKEKHQHERQQLELRQNLIISHHKNERDIELNQLINKMCRHYFEQVETFVREEKNKQTHKIVNQHNQCVRELDQRTKELDQREKELNQLVEKINVRERERECERECEREREHERECEREQAKNNPNFVDNEFYTQLDEHHMFVDQELQHNEQEYLRQNMIAEMNLQKEEDIKADCIHQTAIEVGNPMHQHLVAESKQRHKQITTELEYLKRIAEFERQKQIAEIERQKRIAEIERQKQIAAEAAQQWQTIKNDALRKQIAENEARQKQIADDVLRKQIAEYETRQKQIADDEIYARSL